jgi:hypothetical protein
MTFPRRFLAVPVALLLASCTGDAPGGPLAPGTPGRSTSAAPVLIDCPATVDSTSTKILGPSGGTLRVGRHRLDAPVGAVTSTLGFRAEVRSSPYFEVDFSAYGWSSYVFNRPVQITLDYSRCPAESIEGKTLHVLYIDPVTKTILQDLGGYDDRSSRTITTSTNHLSDYAIGAN